MKKRRLRSLFSPVSKQDALRLPDILRQETVGGILMISATIAAMAWANAAPHSYHAIAEFHVGPLSIKHWTADGLLTIFFLVAGLELKRELVEGSLRRPASALVPIVAAAAGMAVPAGLYVAANTIMPQGSLDGWAIPMATDIAFALAVLAIVGSALPANLRAFLLTLAIVDDLGAIIIIAVFFTESINWVWLFAAIALLIIWRIMLHFKLRGWWLYIPIGVATWWCTLQSGIHATIAGVALGLLVPTSAEESDDAVDRWEHVIRPVSAGLAVPLFALFAAGITLDANVFKAALTSPIAIGIFIGLVVGKLLGVWTGAYVSARATGRRRLPRGVRWREVAGVAQLAGIGFTVSLLLCELSFASSVEYLTQAKTAVLAASVVAAVVGGVVLRRRHLQRRREEASPTQTVTSH